MKSLGPFLETRSYLDAFKKVVTFQVGCDISVNTKCKGNLQDGEQDFRNLCYMLHKYWAYFN